MRTHLELPPPQLAKLTELDERMRHVGADLMSAFRGLPSPDETPFVDQQLVDDLSWTIAEAQRLAREYRSTLVRRLQSADRLAGTTPGQSHHASFHDPPDACQHGDPPP